MTATFEDLGGKTRLTWRMLFDTTPEFQAAREQVVAGNLENLEKLAARLRAMDASV